MVMNEKNTPGVPGQEIDPSINPLTEILTLLRGIGTRLDILEQRFEYLDRDVLKAIDAESIAVTDAEPEPPRVPSLAFTANGRVILSVTYLGAIDLGERETWTGVVLSEAEACDALDALCDGADDAAAHVGGRLIAMARKKAKGEPEGSGSDGDE
jgi:hypothetical protein